ncbi:MAG: molybdopterin converting factor subunit 1 [Zoogloeaceae bacterium]|jgi:molybdopterin synthase sulfur carrier subunit|nr:molybdopterin converting factor subunit 1 [Zoogloeaceae bacterium]
MNVHILYFASLREALGASAERIDLPAEARNAGALRDHLAARGGPWQALAQTKNLRVAVNQTMTTLDAPVQDGDEIAFFPPVTGG